MASKNGSGNIEDAAWDGQTRKQRRTNFFSNISERVKITGYIPDMRKFVTGVASMIGGAAAFAVLVYSVAPEAQKITDAAVCSGDCFWSHTALFGLGILLIAGGLIGLLYGLQQVYAGAGFEENTLTVKITKSA